MKQLGNLAIVCAQRPDVSLLIEKGVVTLTISVGTGQTCRTADWRDNTSIEHLIHELNHGALRIKSADS
jgi:hypothetical protein